METLTPILILSDGRAGHLNQSIAFAKHMNIGYDVLEVRFIHSVAKILSYMYDRLGIYSQKLFTTSWKEEQNDAIEKYAMKKYSMVVGTGSSTYYATKVLAKKMLAKSVTMMLPKGYRYDHDVIFAQKHDEPPKQNNIVEILANFAYVEPLGIFNAKQKTIGIVIGGDNNLFELSSVELKKQLDMIVNQYAKEYHIAITTSPRTSHEIETLVKSYGFEYEVIFSQNPVNPIPDFLEQCDVVFITMDSTSMVSEAISYGKSSVIILPLEGKKETKFNRFLRGLEKEGYVHIFDGVFKEAKRKLDFKTYTIGLRL